MERAKFAFQAFVSSVILFFCMAKISEVSGDELALYWGAITGILGYWLPSPVSK